MTSSQLSRLLTLLGQQACVKAYRLNKRAGLDCNKLGIKLALNRHTFCTQVPASQVLSFSSNFRSFYRSQFTTKSITIKMKQNLSIF